MSPSDTAYAKVTDRILEALKTADPSRWSRPWGLQAVLQREERLAQTHGGVLPVRVGQPHVAEELVALRAGDVTYGASEPIVAGFEPVERPTLRA